MALSEQELIVEQKMSAAYDEQVAVILANPNKYTKKTTYRQVGLETEYPIVDGKGNPCTESDRDAIKNAKPWLQPELGAAQIELTTDPEPINTRGISRMIDQLADREAYVVQAAAKRGLHVLRSGTNPWLRIGDTIRTNKPKYQQVPDFYDRERTIDDTQIGIKDKVDICSLGVITLFQSIQLNIEARNAEDGIDLLNRAIATSPTVVAITGNSRYLEQVDTGLADMRMLAWKNAVDTRTQREIAEGIEETRAGMPDNYYDSLSDYFAQVRKYPFILDKPAELSESKLPEYAMAVGIGMYWKDARLKIIGDSLIVEPRPIPMQPTLEENIAAVLMYLGRLNYSQIEQESLLPMTLLKQNKMEAMAYGLRSKLWTTDGQLIARRDAKEIMTTELEKAKEGLRLLGLSPDQVSYVDLLEDRLYTGIPSDKLAGYVTIAQQQGASPREAIIRGLQQQKAIV